MRLPRPFTVHRDGKIVLIIHCYSFGWRVPSSRPASAI